MPFCLPRWIAHRGGGSLAPENTLLGIRRAAAAGFRAVEFDVMLSGDGTPVLIHDETLERTTNGAGKVCETPDTVLFSLDAGDGEKIPCFVDAACLCHKYGLLANIEIKPAIGFERQTAVAVAKLAAEMWRDAQLLPLISSFSLEALEVARDLAPQLPRGLLYSSPPIDWSGNRQRLAASTLHCASSQVTQQLIAEARELGVPVLAYTVNKPAEAKTLFVLGVSALYTDRLDLFSSETLLA